MNAGLPGTGIGGLFYIGCALLMPVHRAVDRYRGHATVGISGHGGHVGRRVSVARAGRSWRRVMAQGSIAVGILLSLFITGWMLGLVLTPALSVQRPAAVLPHVQSVVRWVALLGTAGLLTIVLGAVEAASFVVTRRARTGDPLRGPSLAGKTTAAGRSSNPRSAPYETIGATLPLLLLMTVPAWISAQSTSAAPPVAATSAEARRLLAKGDSAFTRGDSATAREAYRSLLSEMPDQSRAVYQLARMEPAGSQGQIGLFGRYTRLEPQDAWGFLALGQAYEDAGEPQSARDAYARALALEPGSEEMQEAAVRLNASEPATPLRLHVEPLGRVSADSDNNRTVRAGLSAAVSTSAGLLVGAVVSRMEVSDDQATAAGWEGALTGDWRPSRALLLNLRSGMVMADRLEGDDFREPVAQLRVRWRPAGASLDVRLRREPLQATPQLFRTPVILSEARGTIELPLVSLLHVRGFGRYGRLAAPLEVNERTAWGVGPALRLPAGVELNTSFARTAYAHPSAAGYFAPRRVDAVDAGVYAEPSPWGPLSLALDLGGGVERVTRHPVGPGAGSGQNRPSERAGTWHPALRLWMQTSWALAAAGEVRLELEAYRTQMADAVTSEASTWRWGSLGLSTVWRP